MYQYVRNILSWVSRQEPGIAPLSLVSLFYDSEVCLVEMHHVFNMYLYMILQDCYEVVQGTTVVILERLNRLLEMEVSLQIFGVSII